VSITENVPLTEENIEYKFLEEEVPGIGDDMNHFMWWLAISSDKKQGAEDRHEARQISWSKVFDILKDHVYNIIREFKFENLCFERIKRLFTDSFC